MADHLDSPSAKADPRVDITDLYVFHPGRSNLDRTVLAMNVNPLAGIIGKTTFRSDAIYEINIDTNGDTLTDIAYRFIFPDKLVLAKRATGDTARTLDDLGGTISVGPVGQVITKGDVRLFAGLRDDPFFFDLLGFLNGLRFTGTDFFAGKNVTSIVLEVPTSWVGSGTVGVWCRTLIPDGDGLGQVDRMGRPAINTVFVHTPDRKDLMNSTTPTTDRELFTTDVVDTLLALGNTQERAEALASVLLPDLLTFDTTQPSAFLNGRNLDDDVIDAELALIIANPDFPKSDGVNANDVPFLTTFPYMAEPH